MPEDDRKIPRFATPRTLAPEQKAAFQKIGEQHKAFAKGLANGLAAIKAEDELRARARRERRQETVWRRAAEASEAELAARITARRAAAPAPAKPNSPPAATARPALQPALEHSGRALVRRFLGEKPMLDMSAARIREAMGGDDVDRSAPAPGSWTAKEAERLKRQLNVPSESTIQRELNARQLDC